VCVGLMGCDQDGEFKGSKGRAGANIMQNGTDVLLHGTGVDGNSHPVRQKLLPIVRVFVFKDPHVKSLNSI
jgi:hypothetical protein